MIKINLLPTKKSKRIFTIRIGLRPSVTLLIATVLLVVIFESLAWYWLNNTVAFLSQEKQVLDVRLRKVEEKVKEVENYEKDKKTYEEKIVIIQNLKKNQKGPVYILDEISQMLPDRVWIVSLKETGGAVNVNGAGMTNDDIVKYVNNLKTSRLIGNVQLLESRQVVESNIPIYNFSLTFNVNLDKV